MFNLDVFLEIVKKSELPDINNLCRLNKLFYSYWNRNKEYIYKHLIKRDFPGRENISNEIKYKSLLGHSKDNPDMLSQWYTGKDQSHKLIEYIYDLEMFNNVMKTKPNVNIQDDYGSTPLMIALQDSKLDIVNILLEAGADVNIKDTHNSTALMIAVECSTSEIINRLLDFGADVNVVDKDGSTPLTLAAEHSTPEIINRILEAGADVNVKDKYGWTPLIFSIQSEKPEITNILLDAGSDINARDLDNWTPFMYSIMNSRIEIVMRLLDGKYNRQKWFHTFNVCCT